MARWSVVIGALFLAGCGGGQETGAERATSDGERVSVDGIAGCIKANGWEVLVERHGGFLVYETVSARSSLGSFATIHLYKPEYAERAEEEEESLRFYAEPEERDRFSRVGSAVVAWEASPSAADNKAVMECLRQP